MMSNLYGYRDYYGPADYRRTTRIIDSDENQQSSQIMDDDDDDDEEEIIRDDDEAVNHHHPLQVGFWMEGDSLAPPCGSEIPIIHQLLEFANVGAQDTLYDLGCGDGRVCIEAFARHGCSNTVGVEIESDLVDRANFLISQLVASETSSSAETAPTCLPRILRQDLRNVLKTLVRLASTTATTTNASNDDDDDDFTNDDDKTISSETTALPLPTVVVLYLLPEALREIESDLISLLKKAESSSQQHLRIVCIAWGLPSLEPTRKGELIEQRCGTVTTCFLYTKQSLASSSSTQKYP